MIFFRNSIVTLHRLSLSRGALCAPLDLIKNVHNKKIYREQLCRLTIGTARRTGRAGEAPTLAPGFRLRIFLHLLIFYNNDSSKKDLHVEKVRGGETPRRRAASAARALALATRTRLTR